MSGCPGKPLMRSRVLTDQLKRGRRRPVHAGTFFVCSPMRPPSPHDRTPRLRSLTKTPAGYVSMAVCRCGYMAPLPVASLIQRYGELFPVEQALFHVACTSCGKAGQAEVRSLRLCDPGCGRYRG